MTASTALCSGFILTILGASIISQVPGAQALTDEQIVLLEAIVERRFIGEQHATGMSISVVQGERFQEVFSRGYGLNNIEDKTKPDNETLFGIGSLSKMISTLYIIKAISDKRPELGEGVLDTPILTLAPGFNLTFNDRYRTEYMTFRDLLSHKACVATATDIIGALGGFESKADVIFRQRYCQQSCNFRSPIWAYNNAMIHVAAEAAAALHGTGESFEDLITGFLHDELLMKDTIVIREEDVIDDYPNMAEAYYRRNDEFHLFNKDLLKRSTKFPAAGGILTSSKDMAQFMAVMGTYGSRLDGVQAVQEHVVRWMSRPNNPYLHHPFKSSETDRPRGDTGYTGSA